MGLFGSLATALAGEAKPHRPYRLFTAEDQARLRWGSPRPSLRRKAEVIGLTRETAAAVTIRFRLLDGRPLAFQPGQHVSTYFTIDGAVERRPYSFSGGPGELAITVKPVAGGRVSGFVNGRLGLGDRFEIVGPSGDFTRAAAAPEQQRFAFLAGGAGITPVIGLIRAVLAAPPAARVILVYANHSPADILFKAALDELVARHAGRLTVVHVCTLAAVDGGALAGRLDRDRIASLFAEWRDADHYLCGPAALMALAEAALGVAGVPAARLHLERFTPAARTAPALPGTAQMITLARSGTSFVQKPGQSILDAALVAGLELPFSCTMGGCGHCKQRRLSGAAVMDEPNCLDPADLEQGFVLTCIGHACGPLVLEA